MALKPEPNCAFALAEWNFTNNWSQEEYIQTFSGKFLLSCTFQYHFYILIFLKKFHSVIILNFRFSFFLGRVHRSWKNSERVSAQSVCCAGICCWKQFEGKNTVVWNVYYPQPQPVGLGGEDGWQFRLDGLIPLSPNIHIKFSIVIFIHFIQALVERVC